MRKITLEQSIVLDYLKKTPARWVSPTEVGEKVGGIGRHSAWASPKLKKLVERDLVERNNRGHYKVKHES